MGTLVHPLKRHQIYLVRIGCKRSRYTNEHTFFLTVPETAAEVRSSRLAVVSVANNRTKWRCKMLLKDIRTSLNSDIRQF